MPSKQLQEKSSLLFLYSDSQISPNEVEKITPKLTEEIKRMNNATQLGYDDDRASINLPVDLSMVSIVKTVISQQKTRHPSDLIIVGIGGSNLGAVAIHEALNGRFANVFSPGVRVFSADTVDSDLLGPLCNYLDKKMNAGENILINCISKSGHTTETIANFEILLDLLARHNKKYEQSIVVTTAKDSPLYELSMKKKFQVLEIPKKVGGRFSVFSPVGLFPLGLIGVNIDELLEGARVMRQRCLSENIFDNPAALSAAYLYLHKKKGNTIHNLFLFDPDLESIGRWYRQLMGESIGKEFNTENKQVFEGITPTVSIGTTDLHSTGQLYLGGPFDKFTTFVRVLQTQSKVAIPMLPDYDELVKGIQGKSLGDLMHAVLDGVQSVYRTQKRPFVEIRLPDKSAFSIGQLLQMKMMEIMYLGALFGVNPFNQPNVELYKQETRRILDQ